MIIDVGANRVIADLLDGFLYFGKMRFVTSSPITMSALGFSVLSDSCAPGDYSMMPGEVVNVCAQQSTGVMYLVPQIENDVLIPISEALLNVTLELYSMCAKAGHRDLPDGGFGCEWIDRLDSPEPVVVRSLENIV